MFINKAGSMTSDKSKIKVCSTPKAEKSSGYGVFTLLPLKFMVFGHALGYFQTIKVRDIFASVCDISKESKY